jgi:hypothetical protein
MCLSGPTSTPASHQTGCSQSQATAAALNCAPPLPRQLSSPDTSIRTPPCAPRSRTRSVPVLAGPDVVLLPRRARDSRCSRPSPARQLWLLVDCIAAHGAPMLSSLKNLHRGVHRPPPLAASSPFPDLSPPLLPPPEIFIRSLLHSFAFSP